MGIGHQPELASELKRENEILRQERDSLEKRWWRCTDDNPTKRYYTTPTVATSMPA